MAVATMRQDVSVGVLRREAGRTLDSKAARRILAIACVIEGQSREDTAETCGMDRQTLRDWAHRFNADGPAGLTDLPRQNGPKPRLSPEQEPVVAGRVEQGPDQARAGRRPARAHGGQARESACFACAAQAGVPALVGAPAASKKQLRGAGAFQGGFAGLAVASLPAAAEGEPVEAWFMDEAPAANALRFGESASSPKRRSRLRLGHADPGVGAARHTGQDRGECRAP